MKLDVNVLRYLSKDDFRTLTAVEMGQKNHEIVPAQLVDSIAGLKYGGAFKCLRTLLRHKLVHHDASKYDGYRLTTLGYDFLAIRALVARGAVSGVGRQIGVGKESDVFEVTDDEGRVMALKLHRLGRTSFRAVKSKRDYVRRGSHFSWLYLSRLAALKEFAFMKALGEAGLPVPEAIECNRHAVLMSLVDAYPMVQVRELHRPRKVYQECMDILVRLAQLGLVHCDFNEFNLLITDDEELTLIDFPQMVSTTHPNARDLFERDVQGVVRFFERKLGYLPDDDPALQLTTPSFEDVMATSGMDGGDAIKGADASTPLDAELRASGWKKEHEQTLDRWVAAGRTRREESGSDGEEKERSDSDSDSTSDGTARGDDGVDEGLERASREDAEGNAKFHENDAELAAVGDRDRNEESDEDSGEEIEDAVSSEQGTREDEESFGAREWVDDKRNPTGRKQGAASSLAGLKISDGDVAARTVEERRRAARRSAAAKASRNATKSKNKGKKKGSDVGSLRAGGGW